ncbi:nuclear transport factor 2 family protein [Sporosarcina sp. FA9]|uniref:nuclear transport factor 2 family protein n=1 Tax=Sporosarcina sp. FA9 TaxID=3413030 RepID=UPI003F65711D
MKTHKVDAVNFLQLIVSGEIEEAYKKYVSKDLRHHNPYFKGDMTSLKQGMMTSEGINPNKVFDVKRTIEEGDMVMVYSHLKQNHEDLGAAVVHMFRFQEGKIVEMWDVGQPVPEDSPNENGMF